MPTTASRLGLGVPRGTARMHAGGPNAPNTPEQRSLTPIAATIDVVPGRAPARLTGWRGR